MFDDFIDVRPKSRRIGEFGINILPNGRINLNGKLMESLGTGKISIKFSRDGLEVVVLKDDNGFFPPKNGSFKNEDFVEYLKKEKLQLPIHYCVSLIENNVYKGTLASDVIAKVKKK